MKDDKTLGQKLRAFREQKGLSQFELEIEVGASAGSLSRIENDLVNPTKETILEIAHSLNLTNEDIGYLFSLDLISSQTMLNVINSFSESLDVEDIIQTAVNEIAFKLGYTNVAIFLLDKNKVLWGKYFCQNQMSVYIMNKIRVPTINKLHVDENINSDNLLLRSALDNKIYEGEKLVEFGQGAVPTPILRIIEEFINLKKALALPLVARNKSFGCMFIAKSGQTDYSKEIGLITALSKQIAVMIANVKLLNKMEKDISEEYLFE